MNVGDVVIYYYPKPNRNDKVYILGIIVYTDGKSTTIDCEDTRMLKVSFKNYKRIEVIRSFEQVKRKF